MATLELVDKSGKTKGQVEAKDEIFALEANDQLLYLASIRQSANARAGSAHSKTRPEVRGGGAKPWKQKGTGRARAGTIRSPLWRGGGVVHGPRNTTEWSKGMNKKERAKSIVLALSSQSTEKRITVIEEIAVTGKTKELAALLKTLELCNKTVLLVLSSTDKNYALIKRSAANIPNLQIATEATLGVNEILKATKVIFTKDAMTALEERFIKD